MMHGHMNVKWTISFPPLTCLTTWLRKNFCCGLWDSEAT